MYLNVFWGVQMDIERYNYVDILLRKQRQGTLFQEIQEKENNKTFVKRDKFEQALQDLVRGEKVDEAQIAEVEEEIGFIDGQYASGLGPDGQLLMRNDTDVMNNFFVNFNCRSFTDIDNIMQDQSNNGLVRRFESVKKNLTNRQQKWDNQIIQAYKETNDNFMKLVHDYFIDDGETEDHSVQTSEISETDDEKLPQYQDSQPTSKGHQSARK